MINWEKEYWDSIFGIGISVIVLMISHLLGAPNMSYLEIFSVIFNLTCVYLAVKERILTWVFGIVGVVLLGFYFYSLGLYSSTILNAAFFFPIQFYGLYCWWSKKSANSNILVPSFVAGKHWAIYISFFVLGTFFWGTYMTEIGATQPFLDAAILFLSMIAQYLLVYKRIDTWFIWALVNVLSIYVYFVSGAFALVFQYIIFLYLNYVGFSDWMKTRKKHMDGIYK